MWVLSSFCFVVEGGHGLNSSLGILWQACPGGARILRVFGDSPCPALPVQIEGFPVVEIGPYCFAQNQRSQPADARFWSVDGRGPAAYPHPIAGDFVQGVTLPAGVRALHNAAFYNCRKLEWLCAGSALESVGSDLFTNCRALDRFILDAAPDAPTGLKKLVDEALIGQYLRHPEVARDFAAYWELYKKYRQDYGVEDILQGRPFAAVLERAQKAAFDERISLVSLLLAGLNTRFAAARRADAVTDACYQEMRSFKRTLNNADPAQDGFVPAAVFAAQVNVYADHLTAQKAAGTLTGEELAVVTTASALLHAWVAALDPALDRDAAFDAVRASFNAQVRKREDAVGLAGDALESAFDFMESAFADGQEMVVFVNELALGPDSAAYLADNECERFETYSKRLLLHSGQDDILAELQRDDIRQGEHSMEF